MDAERLRKERDDLLRTVKGLRTERDLARQERADAQQQIDLLDGEHEGERDLKVVVEGVSARLAMEVGQRQEEVRPLEAEVTQQRDEVCKFRADVDGKPSVSLVVILLETHGRPFDTVGM